MRPEQIKKIRHQYGISLAELAGWTGLPSGLIEKIEEQTAVALDTDLDRIENVLTRLVREREKRSILDRNE